MSSHSRVMDPDVSHSAGSHSVLHQQRYHALDALRVSIMLLGIVYHAALNYVVTPLAFYPHKDTSTSFTIDVLLSAIQAFRSMPAFFLVSGFFAALLYARMGRSAFFMNRFKRLVLPFIVFWLLLFIIGLLTFLVQQHLQVHGRWGIDAGLLVKQLHNIASIKSINYLTTGHLWFLYYLILFYVLLVPIVFLLDACSGIRHLLDKVFSVLLGHPAGMLVLCVPVFLVGDGFTGGVVASNLSFIPAFSQMVFYGTFFIAGWYSYKNQTGLHVYRKHCYVYAVLAIVFSIAARFCVVYLDAADAFLYQRAFANLATWLTVFALMGGFMRFFSHHSSFMRYLADASYWVYLVHFRVVLLFVAMLQPYTWSAEIKCLLVIVLTVVIGFGSYHLCVRRTFIGQFLNGKTYPTAKRA